MSSEIKILGAQHGEFSRKLRETQAEVARLYRELLVTTFFPSNEDEITIEEKESRLIKPATPHQPGILLYKDGAIEKTTNGVYQGPIEPGHLEGPEYNKAAETIFQSILPQESKLNSNKCI